MKYLCSAERSFFALTRSGLLERRILSPAIWAGAQRLPLAVTFPRVLILRVSR